MEAPEVPRGVQWTPGLDSQSHNGAARRMQKAHSLTGDACRNAPVMAGEGRTIPKKTQRYSQRCGIIF